MVYGRYNELVNVGYFMVYKATNITGGPTLYRKPWSFRFVFLLFLWGLYYKCVTSSYTNFISHSSVSICLPGVDLFDHLRFQGRDVHKNQHGMAIVDLVGIVQVFLSTLLRLASKIPTDLKWGGILKNVTYIFGDLNLENVRLHVYFSWRFDTLNKVTYILGRSLKI